MTQILAVIPARGSSKGIPRKNLVELAGHPLVYYTIVAAMGAPSVAMTVLSSEDDEILEVARGLGAHPLRRPEHLSTDSASSESVVEHAILEMIRAGHQFDAVLLLQPTSPLRNSKDIEDAVKDFEGMDEANAALISVYEPEHSPYKAFTINNRHYLEALFGSQTPFARRQDLPQAYYANGAIYLVKVGYFLKSGSLFSEHTRPFTMDRSRSIDIDTRADILAAEHFLSLQNPNDP